MGVAFVGFIIAALSATISMLNGAGLGEALIVYSVTGTLGTLMTAALLIDTDQDPATRIDL